MEPLIRSAGVYATGVSAARDTARKHRSVSENDHLALSSTILEGIADKSGPMFRDGSVFGLTAVHTFGPCGSHVLEPVIGRWFCARLNEQLRTALSVPQHEELAAEFSAIATDFRRQHMHLHARDAALAAARHYEAIGSNGRADDEHYRARRAAMTAGAPLGSQLTEILRWLTTGFGYRPYRLVPTAAAAILLASGTLILDHVQPSVALALCVNAYFGWLGTGDVQGLDNGSIGILYAVSTSAIVINSTIVALLARQWFRV